MSKEQNKFNIKFNKPKVLAANYISSKLIEKLARKWVYKFSLSHVTVTLNEGQGHSNRYQSIHCSSVYHHMEFDRNQSVMSEHQSAFKKQ